MGRASDQKGSFASLDVISWLRRRYEPLESLGVPDGGVWSARDRLAPLGKDRVLVKMARHTDAREALNREVDLLLELEHPSLRRVLASGETEDECIAVFEYIDGEELSGYLQKNEGDAPKVAETILRTLVHLHARGLVHGDLKPENILVENGEGRLIDLGLARPLGKMRRGGTQSYVPPEELRGAPLSVAGDLYAFGATFHATGVRLTGRLSSLVSSCLSSSPKERPATADGALAMLGAIPHPVDRAGELPRLGGPAGSEVVGTIQNLLERMNGDTIVVEAPVGSGRSRLIADAIKPALFRRQALADVSLMGGHAPFLELAEIFGIGLGDDPQRSSVIALAAAARAGIAVVIDDGDAASPPIRQILPLAAATLGELGCGALIVVGVDDELGEKILSVGAQNAVRLRLPTIDVDEMQRLLLAAGNFSDPALAQAIHRGAQGRAGVCGRAARYLASRPETTPDEAERLIRSFYEGTSAAEVECDQTLDDVLQRAEEALSRGSSGLTVALIEATSDCDHLRHHPRAHVRAALVLARAKALQGDLESAVSWIEMLGHAAPAEDRLLAARWLERLGRYEEASKMGTSLLDADDPVLQAGAATVIAMAAFGLGEPNTADGIAEEALRLPDLPAHLACRLLCVRSDVALTRGNPDQAIVLAKKAQEVAQRQQDPTLLPQAIAREASAALDVNPRKARDRYQAAFEAALSAGDVVGLPPYVLNLGTAEHSLGELGSAIGRYQQAARLAGRLGRELIRAAALVNWAGLLVDVGAADEAAPVLEDAKNAASASRSALYSAQCELVEASLVGHHDPGEGRRRAQKSRAAFEKCHAARQAVEATLLEAELAIRQGDCRPIHALITDRSPEMKSGGLEARAVLAQARAHRLEGALDEAREKADQAVRIAHEEGDVDLKARALVVLADVHRQLATGAASALALRAREAAGQVAARLPVGLRERYLQHPDRQAPTGQLSPSESEVPRSLGPGPSRLLALVRRLLLEGNETRLLEAAVDEAIAFVRAERAFLLRRGKGHHAKPYVAVARNMGGSSKTRFSRSVAELVLEKGEPVITTSASRDPLLQGARSVQDLGLRSILCVPIRGPKGVIGVLYLDHRFETSRFGPESGELVQALADIIGVALENARLRLEAETKAQELEIANAALAQENERRAVELDRLEQLLEQGASRVEDAPGGMVGRSRALRQSIEVARRVAPSILPVLIEGESGTGKELLARYVHERSLRSSEPFMAINCGAVPETLLESELFGHVRGAFTGASRDHLGLFRAASRGTVLLDEIGEMSDSMQPRLLRVLQEGEIWPVGMESPVPVDVRIIAATNRDLEREVAAGRFRRDLYFRLVGVRLRLPALRERLEDIPVLANSLLERISAEPGMRPVRLTRQATKELLRHTWPGNIRELEQTLRRAVLLADDELLRPADLGLFPERPTRREAIRGFDRELVIQTLKACDGNRTRAARTLGISRSTLHRWLQRYEIT